MHKYEKTCNTEALYLRSILLTKVRRLNFNLHSSPSMHMCTHTLHTLMHIHTHIYTHTYIHTCTYSHTDTHTYTCIHTIHINKEAKTEDKGDNLPQGQGYRGPHTFSKLCDTWPSDALVTLYVTPLTQ